MSSTRIAIEHSHKDGMRLATIDMALNEGQRFSFTYLIPLKPEQTVVELERHLVSEAHRLLGEMVQRM